MAIARAERFRLTRVMDQDRVLAASRASSWAQADAQLHASLEWIGAALAADDRDAEVTARKVAASYFEGAARAAMEASAAVVALLEQPSVPQGFVQGTQAPAQLVNLELALPGCDPRRRAAALHGLGAALGDDAQIDAVALAGWSDLAAGNPDDARKAFRAVVEVRPEDVASWEGIRAASEALGDHVQVALACAQLGSLCNDGARGAAFWEKAGLTLLGHTDAKDDAEISFDRAFERDPARSIAFDKIFRAVRSRNEDDRLLAIIEKRLEVSEDESEIGKLYWERARVLRKKGDIDGALSALENVTMLEPDHVGALALLGEVHITRGNFAEAAPSLARLAHIEQAPKQQRLMSGLAAVDLYEKKLGLVDKALEVLVALHHAGLSTLAVRERLASVAARAGAWSEATAILEKLMNEREKPEGRIEAARLAMAIWRDKLNAPQRGEAAVKKLLDESPDDGEAIDFVLAAPFEAAFKQQVLGRAKQTLVAALAKNPVDADRVALLAKLAQFYQDSGLRQATLGSLVALGRNSPDVSGELGKLDTRVAAQPQTALDAKGPRRDRRPPGRRAPERALRAHGRDHHGGPRPLAGLPRRHQEGPHRSARRPPAPGRRLRLVGGAGHHQRLRPLRRRPQPARGPRRRRGAARDRARERRHPALRRRDPLGARPRGLRASGAASPRWPPATTTPSPRWWPPPASRPASTCRRPPTPSSARWPAP